MSESPAYARHPDHTLVFDEARVALRVSIGGRIIAETRRGLNLREARYAAVVYVPRDDVQMEYLSKSEYTTHCPFKGDASYYDFDPGTTEGRREQIGWSYETPFDQMAALRGHLAFYPDRVQLESISGEDDL